MSKKIAIASIILIILMGIFVRFYDLATHFTHYDDVCMATDILKTQRPTFSKDILVAAYNKNKPSYNDFQKKIIRYIYEKETLRPLFYAGLSLSPVLIIPMNSTTAPIQYFFTTILIHPEQNYRQILFWGRFPSFIFGILCILLLSYFMFKPKDQEQKEDLWLQAIFGTTLLCFSWQQMIWCKNMLEYSIGCFSAMIIIWLYYKIANNIHKMTTKHWLQSGFLLALLTFTHYQILFLIPAFYGSFFLTELKSKNTLINIIKSAAAYLTITSPILYILFFVNTSGVAPYTIGLSGEFLFSPQNKSIINTLIYTISFYIKNFFLIIQNNLTYIPEKHPLYLISGLFYFFLFFVGFASYFKSPSKTKKGLGLFFLFSFLIMFTLVFLRKLALCPTRQALMYLPIMIIFITEGMFKFLEKFKLNLQQKHLSVSAYCILIAIMFFGSFFNETKLRKDPFNESVVLSTLQKYNVQTVVGYNYTLNINLMGSVLKQVNYFDLENVVEHPNSKEWNYRTIAFISTRDQLSEEIFNKYQQYINNDPRINQKIKYNYNNYNTVYKQIIENPVEIEFNTMNRNGSNNLYFYILSLK